MVITLTPEGDRRSTEGGGVMRKIFAANANTPMRAHWILVTHSGAMRVFLRHAFGSDPGEPDFCGVIALEPSAQPNCAALSYQNKTVEVNV